MMKHFGFSIVFSIVCLALSAYWGYTHGPEAGVQTMLTALTITAILAIMEVSLSFDNAVVNASVLRGWDHFWKIIISGYTPHPTTQNDSRLPHIRDKITAQIHKTALGAEQTVPFRVEPTPPFDELRSAGYQIVGLEQHGSSTPLPSY